MVRTSHSFDQYNAERRDELFRRMGQLARETRERRDVAERLPRDERTAS
jgi:hypothetical protein